MLTSTMVKAILPKRPLDSNKGTFGKVMLLCGSPPYPGSAFLAGSAAGRVGVGLVTLAAPAQIHPIYAKALHVVKVLFLPPETAGSFGLSGTLINHAKGYSTLLIWSRLGQYP